MAGMALGDSGSHSINYQWYSGAFAPAMYGYGFWHKTRGSVKQNVLVALVSGANTPVALKGIQIREGN
jgi:hypothetical protein